MRKALIICMGLAFANLALADKNEVQDCKEKCSKFRKTCENVCKKKSKGAAQKQQCVPGCQKGIEVCREECGK